MKFIHKYKSPNYNHRRKHTSLQFIILHYTAMKSDILALDHLCDKNNTVSAHFLINKLGMIYNLVDIKFRAWHAGESYWNKIIDINSSSIGIELDNSGHHYNHEKYTNIQIKSLINLLLFLKSEYRIKDQNILAHSDIAPYRKIDPGEKFPWRKISNVNLVKIPKKSNKKTILIIENFFKKKLLNTLNTKTLYMLSKIGYNVFPAAKNKKNFTLLIRSYQMHFRAKNVSGCLDAETYEVLIGHFKESLTI